MTQAAKDGLRISVLGPVRVSRGDDEIRLRPRARLVLAILVARGEGVPVSTDVLLDLIHGEQAPATALPSLHNTVSELRRAMGAAPDGTHCVSRTDLGYALAVGAALIDALRLDVAEQTPDEIGSLLTNWTRPAYDGLHDVPLLADEAARLEVRRLAVTERWAAKLLTEGDPMSASELLRPALAVDPFATRLAGLQAAALRDLGRGGEADDLLEDHERLHVDELGVRPDRGHVAVDPRPRHRALPPTRRDRLFGRADVVTALLDRLREGSLITLTGPAGVGKTRCAEAVGHAWPQSVTFVDLSSARDPEDVVRLTAERLGAASVPSGERGSVVAELLHEDQNLLIIDHAEHVADGVQDLLRELSGEPDLRVLVTSRRRIDVAGEYVIPLDPLTVDDAIRMLLDRAGPDRDPLPDEETALRELVTRLDCLPLTVELAARPLRTLGPAELVAGMHELVVASADGYTTLASALKPSLPQLSAATRAALAACTEFEGPFTAEHAAEIAGEDPSLFRRELHELVERSFVRREAGATTYRMLGSIREALLPLMADEIAEAELTRRHTELFARLARRNEHELVLGEGGLTLDEMSAEAEDYRAALSRLIAIGDPTAVRMARQLMLFWFFSGRLTEGRELIHGALASCGDRTIERARLLSAASTLAQCQGDFSAVERLLGEAADIARESGRTLFVMQAEGGIAFARGDVDRADELFERALEEAIASGKNPDMGADMAATCAWYRGRFDDVFHRFDLMGSLMRSKGVPAAQARWLRGRGLASAMLGDPEAGAVDCFRSLEIEREHGTDLGRGHALLHVGLVERVRGNPVAAMNHLDSATACARRVGDTLTLVAALAGRIALGLGDPSEEAVRSAPVLAERLGEYDKIRHRWRVPAPPDLAADVELVRAEVIARLGPEKFASHTRIGER